ncbi:hypothetical protein SAY87_015803 [Trapa incisa]|uniref:Uncharacterized protein n=1 Tax=Trapa incisa TaxID=236973 RepID=A0AAN7L4X5_9MYRT|nr:hypothetical protein SAY87_015803 [Trapa incisa]
MEMVEIYEQQKQKEEKVRGHGSSGVATFLQEQAAHSNYVVQALNNILFHSHYQVKDRKASIKRVARQVFIFSL